MKPYRRHVVTLALLLLASQPLTVLALGFGELVDHMDSRKQTSLHAKEYWQNVKGTEVTWSGVVYDVKGGSSSGIASRGLVLFRFCLPHHFWFF